MIVGLFQEYAEGKSPRDVIWLGTGINNESYCISLEEAKELADNINKLLKEYAHREKGIAP